MDRRQKDITTMAEMAELVAVSAEKRNGRQYITCRADNGAERAFSISLGSKGDARGDQNELSAMKRFARENAEQTPQPKKRDTLTMTKPDRNKPTVTIDPNQEPVVKAMSPVDFYRACEWLKVQNLQTFPDIDALVLGAAKHIETAFLVEDVTVAMKTVGISAPAHWAEPTDPHAILVRELSTVMKELGVAESPAFARLRDKLLPA